MSTYSTRFHINELILDNNGNIVEEYETNLPDHKFLCEEMCQTWNDTVKPEYFDGILEGKIKSITMEYGREADGHSYGRISTVMMPGIRLTERIRNEIDEQITAQFSDGWGEGFFYPVHMTTPGGKIIAAE